MSGAAAAHLAASQRLVVLCGPTLSPDAQRWLQGGPGTGFTPEQAMRLGQARAVVDEPLALWRYFGAMREALAQVPASPAHLALARLEAGLRPEQDYLLLSLAIDSLHQRAGSQRVVELRGSLRHTRCSRRNCRMPPYADDRGYADGPPPCPACGGRLRPDVVLAGEPWPVDALWQAQRALRECDTLMVLGCAAVLDEVSGLLALARQGGARLLWIDHGAPPSGLGFDRVLLGEPDALLPGLL